MIDEQIQGRFPELFGVRTINGRSLDVEETVTDLTRELRPMIAAALAARRTILESPAPTREKYAWPAWDEAFDDPVTGTRWTFLEIVEGLIDNALGRETRLRWRLNDEAAIPSDAHPSRNPGLELTGPWHPLDMAFNALNSAAPMNMPDFEDASPPHFEPDGTARHGAVGVFAALQNAKEIFEGRWTGRAYEVVKKGETRRYTIHRPPEEWPTRFVRPPGIHVRFDHIVVDGEPAPGVVAVTTLWVLNNYSALVRLGTNAYFYVPKIQTPKEAIVIERLLERLEALTGVQPGTFKIKVLYEEGNAGRYLPAIAWVLRRRLLGTNVGRWDYLGSLIEMWKDEASGIYPDPQSIGMASPNMIAYQRYNALVMLMAGMKNGELTHAAPIGGMAAVMIYPAGDPYGRSRYNPLALRAMAIDKLRERLLGLIQVRGTLYDAYRQSWVASPEPAYVAAGNAPLRASLDELQALIDAPIQTVEVKGTSVPTAASGLVEAERAVLQSRGVLDANGRITPWVLADDSLDTPEKLLTADLWERIYGVPEGEVTIERVQHAFYMAANYGFQILNGNFAAAIDDYELSLRFMNDLATYRIDVSWLWTLLRHHAAITRDGHVKGPALTEDGVVPAINLFAVAAGTRMTPELFQRVWDAHDEWTAAFFAELDRRGDPGRFDRGKAPIIMDILRRQLLSPRYIQHSARVLFVVAQANAYERVQILHAIFDLPRAEIAARVEAGRMVRAALAAHDYVFDIFPA